MSTVKVVLLRIATKDDDRNMEQFVQDCKAALYEMDARPTNITSMGEEYIVDGQRVRTVDYESPEPEPDPEPEPEPDPEPEPEPDPEPAPETA